MAAIKIADLSVTGSELFADSESYLDEVSNSDVLSIKGGTSTPACVVVGTLIVSGIVGYFSRG